MQRSANLAIGQLLLQRSGIGLDLLAIEVNVGIQLRVHRLDAIGELGGDLRWPDRAGPDGVGKHRSRGPAQFGVGHSYSLGRDRRYRSTE